MKKYFLMIFILIGCVCIAPFSSCAFSGADGRGCGGNCRDCHTLPKKDAEAIIKKLNPELKVVDVKQAPVNSLWQIDVDAGQGKRGPVYLDFSKKNLLVVQQIIPVESIGKKPPERTIRFSSLPLESALVMGPKSAKHKVAVFTDPDCPYCRKLHEEMRTVLKKRKDTAFYIFLRPLAMHKDAFRKSEAILCEKSLDLLDAAMAGKPMPAPSCSNAKAEVEKNNALADSLEFRGTPMIVREDGQVNQGLLPADQLSAWIDKK